jgi:hypothetical protein
MSESMPSIKSERAAIDCPGGSDDRAKERFPYIVLNAAMSCVENSEPEADGTRNYSFTNKLVTINTRDRLELRVETKAAMRRAALQQNTVQPAAHRSSGSGCNCLQCC